MKRKDLAPEIYTIGEAFIGACPNLSEHLTTDQLDEIQVEFIYWAIKAAKQELLRLYDTPQLSCVHGSGQSIDRLVQFEKANAFDLCPMTKEFTIKLQNANKKYHREYELSVMAEKATPQRTQPKLKDGE